MPKADRGDLQVVGTNHFAANLQVMSDACVLGSVGFIERQLVIWGEQRSHSFQPHETIAILFCTV